MTIVEIIKRKMILLSEGNIHDIEHFLKVHSYAKLIGESEGLEKEMLETLEISALLHDIACPLCRKKYGNTDGKRQEEEGRPLTYAFLEKTDIALDRLERIVFLVGTHHTLKGVEGLDHQILVEADFLVNAAENGYSESNIHNALETIFQTKTGKELLQGIYLNKEH